MTTLDKKSSLTRNRLLETAGQLILSDGIRHLTLDAVAQRAQVSKGGLLYHFPSKDALLEGLIQYLLELFNQRVEAQLQQANESPDVPGRWMRAYVRATFESAGAEYELIAALTAVVAEDPSLITSVKKGFERFEEASAQDGLSFELATLVRLAADGLWYNEALGLQPLNETHRKAFLAQLLDLTHPKPLSND